MTPQQNQEPKGRWTAIIGDKVDSNGLHYAHIHELFTYRFTIIETSKHNVEFYAQQILDALNQNQWEFSVEVFKRFEPKPYRPFAPLDDYQKRILDAVELLKHAGILSEPPTPPKDL